MSVRLSINWSVCWLGGDYKKVSFFVKVTVLTLGIHFRKHHTSHLTYHTLHAVNMSAARGPRKDFKPENMKRTQSTYHQQHGTHKALQPL